VTVRSDEQGEDEACRHPRDEIFGAYQQGHVDAWCRVCGQRWSDPESVPVKVLARVYELSEQE